MAVDIPRVATQTRRLPIHSSRSRSPPTRCKGCELCVDVCPKHCLALDTAVVNALGYHPVRLTDAGACTSCALCARICPDVVFTVYARPRRRS